MSDLYEVLRLIILYLAVGITVNNIALLTWGSDLIEDDKYHPARAVLLGALLWPVLTVTLPIRLLRRRRKKRD